MGQSYMGQTIKVNLIEPKELYSMHDTLQGVVVADFAKEINVVDIAVKIKCQSVVDISYGKNNHDISTKKHFQITLTVFPPPELAGAAGQQGYTLGAGHREWPFAIDLSPYAAMPLPPTSHGSGLSCTYKVEYSYKAVVHRDSKWKRNLRDPHPFKLYPCIDVEAIDYARRRVVKSELVFKQCIPDAKAAHFFSRTPRFPNTIFAELTIAEYIPQLPRKLGLRLRLYAEKEFVVERIKCVIHQTISLTAVSHRTFIDSAIPCGEASPKISGTDIDLTESMAGFGCEAIQAYNVGLLRCTHQLRLSITIRDPSAKNRTAKLKIETPINIVTSQVHRHNAPAYQDKINEGYLPEKTSAKPSDKLEPPPHVDLQDALHTKP